MLMGGVDLCLDIAAEPVPHATPSRGELVVVKDFTTTVMFSLTVVVKYFTTFLSAGEVPRYPPFLGFCRYTPSGEYPCPAPRPSLRSSPHSLDGIRATRNPMVVAGDAERLVRYAERQPLPLQNQLPPRVATYPRSFGPRGSSGGLSA